MREIGNATIGAGQRAGNGHELTGDPDAENKPGRQVDKPHENDDQHEGSHSGPRVQYQIGAKDACDASRRPDHRRRRGGVDHILGQRRRDAAQNIEDHEAHRPHRIFDIVAKNPQIQHVATDMHPAAMKKHGRDHGCPGRNDGKAWRQRCNTAGVRRHEPVLVEGDAFALMTKRLLPEKDDHAQCDDRPRNPWCSS